MRKALLYITLLLLWAPGINAQKLRQKQANKLARELLRSLNSNDTSAFVNLWNLDERFTRIGAIGQLERMKDFIKPLLLRNITPVVKTVKPDLQDKAPRRYTLLIVYTITKDFTRTIAIFVIHKQGKWYLLPPAEYVDEIDS